MELLRLQSLNGIKIRLARLEAMGLIEVQPGKRGPLGTTPNLYRLRCAYDGRAASRVFQTFLSGRTRKVKREGQAGEEEDQLVDTPRVTLGDTPRVPLGDTPRVTLTDTSPSGITSVLSQSVSQLVTELNRLKKLTDGLTELINYLNKNMNKNQSVSQSVSVGTSKNKEIELTDRQADELAEKDHIFDLNVGLKAMLKATDPSPWPEALLLGLGRILDPLQVAVIEERSPWSAAGAWTILWTISTAGRNLGNQPGTLWNALLRQEKGVRWLAKAGPSPGPNGGRPAPKQDNPPEGRTHEPGGEPICHQSDTPLSWQGGVTEGDASCRSQVLANEDENRPYPDEEEAQKSMEPVSQPNEVQMNRPEEFSPDLKAELRISIESYRNVIRAALRSPAANRPGGYDDFSRSWNHIVEVLDPVLPFQVSLPDEYRPVAIRQRSQIKANVVNAIYRAVS